MVVGDAVNTIAVGTLNVQPASGIEWIIHNIFHNTDTTLSIVSSANTITFDTDVGAGIWAKYPFHATNTFYLQAISSGTIAADGIVSK